MHHRRGALRRLHVAHALLLQTSHSEWAPENPLPPNLHAMNCTDKAMEEDMESLEHTDPGM